MKRHRVNRLNRCPICNSDTWCVVGDDDALCMRTPSDRPHTLSDGSTGYWHSLTGERPVAGSCRQSPTTPVDINVPELIRKWTHSTAPSQLCRLAEQLGVRASALVDMNVCYAEEHRAFAFPMRDGFGNMVGIRLRNFLGDKWSVRGSHSGLFIPQSLLQ